MPKKKKKKYIVQDIRHKHLNDLGIQSDECAVFNTTDKDEYAKRLKRFKKQRQKYGFDERETWALDWTSAGWFYSHLIMYKKTGGKIVDFTFNKFDIPVLVEIPDEEKEHGEGSDYPVKYYKEVTENHTQLECIDICIDYLKFYLGRIWDEKYKEEGFEGEFRGKEKAQCAFKIYSIIFPDMWW